MAKAQNRAERIKPAYRLKVGFRCWFLNPADSKAHEGIYCGKRTIEEMAGFKRTTVPPSIVIHAGPKPVEGTK
jgi:hypothetical protein